MFRRPSNEAVRLSLIYGLFLMVPGIQMPFWPVWLQDHGLSAVEIAGIAGVGAWIKVASNPLLTNLSDRMGPAFQHRLLPIIALIAASLMPLFAVIYGFWPLLALTAITSGLFSGVLPLAETLTLAVAKVKDFEYTRIRVWGSLSFVAALTVAGWVVTHGGAVTILPMIVVGTAITALTCLCAPPNPAATEPSQSPHATLPFMALFHDRGFVWFLVAASIGHASHAVYYTFATLNWQAAGLNPGVISGLWVVGVGCEIVLFFFPSLIVRKVAPTALLLIGCATGVVRWLALAFISDPWMLVPFQALHAATFAVCHLAAMRLMSERVDSRLAARAQGVYSALVGGAVIGLATLVSGPLFAHWGGLAYLFSALLSATAVAAAWQCHRRWGEND